MRIDTPKYDELLQAIAIRENRIGKIQGDVEAYNSVISSNGTKTKELDKNTVLEYHKDYLTAFDKIVDASNGINVELDSIYRFNNDVFERHVERLFKSIESTFVNFRLSPKTEDLENEKQKLREPFIEVFENSDISILYKKVEQVKDYVDNKHQQPLSPLQLNDIFIFYIDTLHELLLNTISTKFDPLLMKYSLIYDEGNNSPEATQKKETPNYKLLLLYLYNHDGKLDRQKHVNKLQRKLSLPNPQILFNYYRELEKFVDGSLSDRKMETWEKYKEQLSDANIVNEIKKLNIT